jgi:ABC-type Na+ transport system ATPase subunit NatA
VSALIETQNLTKTFGEVIAVEDLTLHVGEGEVFGFLGPNGAGKTTTIRMLACLISKTSGEARIGEYEVGNDADVQKIRKIIGLMPDRWSLRGLERLSEPRLLWAPIRVHGSTTDGEDRTLPQDVRAVGGKGSRGQNLF